MYGVRVYFIKATCGLSDNLTLHPHVSNCNIRATFKYHTFIPQIVINDTYTLNNRYIKTYGVHA